MFTAGYIDMYGFRESPLLVGEEELRMGISQVIPLLTK